MNAKIKRIECGYAKERDLTIKKGTLKFMGNLKQRNVDDWVKETLLKKL